MWPRPPPRCLRSSSRAEANLSRLTHPKRGRPFEVLGSTQAGKAGPFGLRSDVIRYPGGEEVPYHVVIAPDSVIVVPHFENGDTMLVRQWRHAWDESSWEVPAGTLAKGEDPLCLLYTSPSPRDS